MYKEVKIYTDGACSGNPGAGGWAAVLIYKNREKRISGYCADTTNNRMEIQAVIDGLKLLKEKCLVTIYTDSAYVSNAFINNWIDNWKLNNWKTASNQPVKNLDLWMELDRLLSFHLVEFIKVRGHTNNKYNEICDAMARKEIEDNR